MQAIGMAVQRGNAASVLGTVCKGQHLEELYYNVSSLLVCFSEVHNIILFNKEWSFAFN